MDELETITKYNLHIVAVVVVTASCRLDLGISMSNEGISAGIMGAQV